MSSFRLTLPVSSTCGRCGYSACTCFACTEYPPFCSTGFGSHYPRVIRDDEEDNGRGYGCFTNRFRSEVDGLQAGVEYLDTLEDPAGGAPLLSQIRRKSLKELLKLEEQRKSFIEEESEEGARRRERFEKEKAAQKLAAHNAPTSPYSTTPEGTVGFGLHDSYTDQFFQDGTEWDDEGNEWPELSTFFPSHFFSASGPAKGQSTGVAYGPIPTCLHEEKSYGSQQYTGSKKLPTINTVPIEEIANVAIKDTSTIAKKVPQKSQWGTLHELHLSSRVLYMKFLRLTTNHNSKGIKMLSRMYGNAKGMLDAGITTFRHVLDGQEPQSLKGIFAFTCLSYVMSKLLEKHGRMEGSQVLADTDQWRLAIKKDKDRLVYDQAVKILWPEIDFLKEHSKEKDANPTPPPTESPLGNMAPPDLTFNAPTRPLYVPSSMLASGMTTTSDFKFFERNRAADYSNIENNMQSALPDPDSRLDSDNQSRDHGLHDHLMGLFQETSTHDNFMFADFLNFGNPPWDINLDLASEKLPPDITPMIHPPDRPSQMFPPNEPVATLDPKKPGKSSPLTAMSEVLPLSPKANQIHTVPPLLRSLIETVMFQVAVAFMKFITSLGDLLFRLSGWGITSRRNKHEVKGYIRPVQEFSEFITGSVKLVLEPIKEDLGEADESVDAVLCMAETFVRLGRLQTVREIEEYIITTARYLACDYTSFTAIVSKTLKRCLAASDRMIWDHIYPSYASDQEDYSTTYIQKIEAIEIEWALENFKKEDGSENNINFTTTNAIQTTESVIARCGSHSSSNSDSPRSKKQKLSTPSPNSSTEHQSSTTPASSYGGDLPVPSRAQCHYANCVKLYTGNNARVNLRRHIRIAHEGCKMIKCPTCGHGSSRRDNLRKHFLLKHKGEEIPAVLICKTRA